jgi:hypothetical protein
VHDVWLARAPSIALVVLLHAGVAAAQATPATAEPEAAPAPASAPAPEPEPEPTLQVRRLPDVDETAPASTTPASAQGAAPQPAAASSAGAESSRLHRDREVAGVWYGWQTLTVDVLSIGFEAIGIAEQQVAPALIGSLGVYFATPIVHFAHGRGVACGVSLAARLLVGTVATFGLIACAGNGSSRGDGCTLMAVAALGLPAMIIIDASVLAREPPRRVSGASALRPWIDARNGTTGLAYHAAF